jgi:DNA-directed RNA polymerase specialized sigma24 family protein
VELVTGLTLGTVRVGTDPAGMDFPGFVASRSAGLFRGALVLTGSRDAPEELVQETPERVCRKWRTIAALDAPDAYVRRIMVNLANDRWRRFRRAAPAPPGGEPAAPGDEYGRIDSRDQLVRALQHLPMRMRTVVVLRYFHDLSDEDIATAATPPGTSPSNASIWRAWSWTTPRHYCTRTASNSARSPGNRAPAGAARS